MLSTKVTELRPGQFVMTPLLGLAGLFAQTLNEALPHGLMSQPGTLAAVVPNTPVTKLM